MVPELLARQTTLGLIHEAIGLFGPLSDKELQVMLDESPHATSHALSRLLLLGRVEMVRTADRDVVLYETRRK